MRSSVPPPIDAGARTIVLTFNKHCITCHKIDGVGGTEGPDLSKVGSKIDAGIIERRIMNPFDVQSDAQMPGFADELTQEQVRAIAVWLAGKK